jgi:hypothetical protein
MKVEQIDANGNFLHNNNLANFMWNKDSINVPSSQFADIDQTQAKGSRVRKEYNIHDGQSTQAGRPLTRSNQRRPVSR